MSNKVIEGFRLSPQQAHLWSLQHHEDERAYRAQAVIKIEGPLDATALEAALNTIISRHEILRTTFRSLTGMSLPLQVISNHTLSLLPLYDLSHEPSPQQDERLGLLLQEIGSLPIDLDNNLPMHVWLVKTASNQHILLLSIAALCMDAIGLKNLFYDLAFSYANRSGDEGPASEPMQYADFADWQNEILTSVDSAAGRAHWQQNDSTDFSALSLQLKKSITQQHGVDFQYLRRVVGAGVVQKIENLAASYEASTSGVLLASFQLLLWRLTQSPEVVTGVAMDGRNYEELKLALGVFSRYLPLCTRFGEQLTFANLLQEVEQQLKEAEQWQEFFSFRTSSPHVSFKYEFVDEKVEMVQSGPVQFNLARAWSRTDRSDVWLRCLQQADGSLIAEWHYDGRLYGMDDIERLAAEWQTVLDSVTARPEAPVREIDILDFVEHAQLIVNFNETSATEVNTLCLHELIEVQVERTPDAVAVEFEQRRLTFRELDRRANRLAQFLKRNGVTADTRVAILVERSPELVVGMLGILKAGGAYVPLDSEYPAERLTLMLQDSGARVVVTHENLRNLLDQIGDDELKVVSLDSDWPEIEKERAEPIRHVVNLGNLAYVIYTSGSTGRPKGVMIPHEGICNRLLWIQREFPLTEADSLLQKTPISFDASVWEIFVPLLSGARLVLAEPGGHRDSSKLVETIAKHQITTLQLVPSMLRVFLDEPNLDKCSHLRRVFCGGEALPAELQQKFFARMKAELVNLYGPTETSIDATFRRCDVNDEQCGVLIGQSIANIQVYILDSRLEPAPIGCSGELHVGGIGLARGYLNRPDLTAERFLPNRFSSEAGQRLYRTGDLARYLPDGTIEYLGRIDHQVKLRGFRIEPGEIESILCEQRGVKAAVVVPYEDQPGRRRLVAYVQPANQNSTTSSNLQLHRLPGELDVNYLSLGEAKLLHEEIFAERSYLQHGITLDDDACVLDIGANIGMFTLFVHEQCRKARVYACEPIPPIFNVLQKNVQLYGLPVKLYQCGVSDRARTTEFTFYPRASATSGMYADLRIDEAMTRAYMQNQSEVSGYVEDFLEGRFKSESYSCQLLTVSDIIRENNIEQIDLLKIDVEKSELDVLNGIEEPDWRRIKQIVVEVHDLEGRLEIITSRLERHGFDFVVEQDRFGHNTGLYIIYATHPNRRQAASASANAGGNLNPLVSVKQLRHALEQKLPDYMVPSAFVVLPQLPRLPNGKIDRASLPAPDHAPNQSRVNYMAPRNSIEMTLQEIWQQVLGIPQLGVNDNFFELGGDSILSIQIVARANQAGLKISPKLLFRHQTIAELSQVATWTVAPTLAQQGLVTGEAALTPIQHSFFEQRLAEQHHFNQALLLEVRRRLTATQVQYLVEQLVLHHDALRLRFKRADGSGEWRQFYGGPEAAQQVRVEEFHLDDADDRESALEVWATEFQRGLNLKQGPLMRVALIELGPNQNQRLLIVIHHLVVDGVSWRILLDDLERGLGQDNRGESLSFGQKTTSFAQWSERLTRYAQSSELLAELDFWSEVVHTAAALPLPLNRDERERTLSSSRSLAYHLEVDETRALLQDVPTAYHTQINDVLLTALVEAIGNWSGERRIAVELEGHGREEISEEVDLSRSVGWFTSVHPLILDLRNAETPGAALSQVKEQLRRIPNGGIGYGVLRYLNKATQLETDNPIELSFNYLGRLDQVLDSDSLFGGASEAIGPQQSPQGRQRYALEVTAAVVQGKLNVRFTYNEQLQTADTIRGLIDSYLAALRDLIAHCQSEEAGGFTPSDFPLIELNQQQLDLAFSEVDFG